MGYDALGTGLAFLPTPIVIGLVSLFAAARLTGRYGPRPVLLAGLSTLAAGLILMSRMPAHPSYLTQMLPPLIVMGLGVGVAIPAVIMLAMTGAAPSDTGMVSGLGTTSQQAGGALGLAVLAAVAATRTESRSAAGAPLLTALRDGYSLSFLLAAAFILTSLLLTAVLLRRPPVTSPESTPSESAASESTASESTPSESTPSESTPSESTSLESTSLESTSLESTSLEFASSEFASSEFASLESTSQEYTSSDLTSSDFTSSESAAPQAVDTPVNAAVVTGGESAPACATSA
jgi:MFS family permease